MVAGLVQGTSELCQYQHLLSIGLVPTLIKTQHSKQREKWPTLTQADATVL